VSSWFTIGRVIIKDNVMVASYNLITPGAVFGKNSISGAFSYVKSEIPDNEFWVGIPAKFKAKLPEGGIQPKKDLEIVRYEK